MPAKPSPRCLRPRLSLYTVALLLPACFFLPPAMAGQLDLDERLDLALQNAPLPIVLQSMAQILGAELDMDPSIDGKVSVEAQSEPWQDILDDLCRTHGLSCEVIPQQPPVLRIRSIDGISGFHLEPGLVDLLDVVLEGAELHSTLEVFAQMADREIDVHPDVQGHVSLTLRRAPWSLALQLACEINHCRILWQDPLRVVPLEDGASNPRFRLTLEQAKRTKALQTATTLPSFLPWAPVEVEVAPAVAGSVDVHLDGASSVEVLDALCAAPSCRWQLVYGAPSVLQIRPGNADDGGPMAFHPPRGQDPIALRVSMREAAPPTQGRSPDAWHADFTWSTPRHATSLNEDEELLVSWLPLRAEGGVLLPMVRRCSSGEGTLLEPIVLPLSEAVERRHGGTILHFETLKAPARDASRASSAAPESRCPYDDAARSLNVTLEGPAIDDAPSSTHHTLSAVAGSYLLIRSSEGQEGQRALVVLPGAHGTLRLALVSLDDGQYKSHPLGLSPGLPHSVTLDDDRSMTLMYDDTGLF